MAEDPRVLLLAQVDEELEKSAGFIQRTTARIKGFSEGFKAVGQHQAAAHGMATSGAALAGQPAPKAPGLMQRLGERWEGGVARGRAAGQLHDMQSAQQQYNTHAQAHAQQTGQAPQLHQGPDYQSMSTSDYMHHQRDPQGYAQAQAAQAAQTPGPASGLSPWVAPAVGAGLVGAAGMYLWNRNQTQQPPGAYGYGYPQYKLGADQAAELEKTAILSHLMHFIPHLGVNAGAMAAHSKSNLNEVLAHHAFQLGLKGHDLHPTRAKALGLTMGPEALTEFNAARALGHQLSGLSPEGQNLAMRGLMRGYDATGVPAATPLLSSLRQAVGHHLAGTAPELKAEGGAAKAYSRVMTDLTQHTYDPNAKQNIIQRGLGHLRGALPALPFAAAHALDPVTAAATAGTHFGINQIRSALGSSQYGKNFMKDQFRAGLEGHETPAWKQKLMGVVASPALYEAEHLGRSVGQSAAGLPAWMLSQHEAATRQQRAMSQPHMQAAANGPTAGPPQPTGGYPQGGSPPGTLMRRYGAPAAGVAALGGLGYTAYKGNQAAQEQSARMQDYTTNAAHNMNTPLPPMTVTASYDEFCEEKVASVYAPLYPTMQNALAASVTQQLAAKFVADPIDAAHKVLQKRLYEEPKQEAAFQEAITGDELLQEAHRADPKALRDTFSTLKAYGPSMAKNPQATKAFLRQAAMSGMHGAGPDIATIRLIAETEKNIQNSKGKGTGT